MPVLAFKDPPTPAHLRRFFFALYENDAKPLRLLSAIRPYVCPYDALMRFVPTHGSVLDVGCGVGSFLAVLAASGLISEGVGCDVSAPALDAARRVARRLDAGTSLTFLQIDDVHAAPEGPFDAVAMVDVLHHIAPSRRRQAVSEAARRVAPGGVFIYKDMTTRSRWRRLAHNLDDYLFTREWVEQVREGAVEAWAQKEGLVLEQSEYIPRLVYGHELRIFRRFEQTADALVGFRDVDPGSQLELR